MLLSELFEHCNRNLAIAERSSNEGAYSIAAHQLGELSNLIQNELQDATTPSGAPAIPAAERTAATTHPGDGRTDEPVIQTEEKTETEKATEEPYHGKGWTETPMNTNVKDTSDSAGDNPKRVSKPS